jgi:hypothetical protein
MRIVLRVIGLLLFLCGAPVFIALGTALAAVATTDPPRDAVEKFLQLYTCFALSGLLTASGALLWSIAKIAYPRSAQK